MQYRVPVLSEFLGLFEQRIRQGTKERCIIIIAGFYDDDISSTCLQELSIDLSNVVHWRTGHLPSVVRFAVSSGQSTPSKSSKSFTALIEPIRVQYFHTPRFELDSSRSAANGSEKAPAKKDPLIAHRKTCINPYDILVCATKTEALETFLAKVLPLQKMEAEYVAQHTSTEYGSGGSLYLVEGKLVSSVSGWRRVDWLVLAQVAFLPRYWSLDDAKSLDEFVNLFDYRHWVSRFDGLEENDKSNLQIVAYPDSDLKTVKKALKNVSKLNLQRRKRETSWVDTTSVRGPSDVKLRRDEASRLASASVSTTAPKGNPVESYLDIWDPKCGETNEYRVTEGHLEVLRELLVYLHREKRFSESMAVLKKFVRNTFSSPALMTLKSKKSGKGKEAKDEAHTQLLAEFDKLEGISLLAIGDADAAVQKLSQYRDYLERADEDARLLGKAVEAASSARVWAEVAGVYCACANFPAAQAAAAKALTLEPTQQSALKTLLLAAGRSGESSMVEEDWIFGFFVSSKSLQLDDAHEYYLKRTQKFPENGFFWYGLAMFLFIMCRQSTPCAPLFERALKLLPNEARVAESYATFLFQSRSPRLKLIQRLYDSALELDPSNLLIRANNAAFHLLFRSAQLSHLENQLNNAVAKVAPSTSKGAKKSRSTAATSNNSSEEYHIPEDQFADADRKDVLDGFDRAQSHLESVLFSVSLVDLYPQVYLECWFYVLCYTMERDRLIQALQYLKAALRKGLRARHWDMSVHLQYLRKHALIDAEDIARVPTLMRIIGDREPLEALDAWALWNGLRTDKLVSNLKLSANSFRVCVSPSKRRETREEPTPPGLNKSKSAPLRTTIKSASIFQDDLEHVSSPTQKHRTPTNILNGKRAATKVTSAKRTQSKATASVTDSTAVSAAKTPSSSTDKPNGTTSGSRSRPSSDEAEDEDMLSLLDSRSLTSGPTSSSTSLSSLTHSIDDLSALDTSTSFSPAESSLKLRSSTSSATPSIFSNLSASLPARLTKSKTSPLEGASKSTGATRAKAAKSRTGATKSPSAAATTSTLDTNHIWAQMQNKYELEDEERAPKMSESNSRTKRSASPTDATSTLTPTSKDKFEEQVPKRPTRAAATEPKISKRPRRI